MAKKQARSRNIVAIIVLVLLLIAVLGLVAYFTNGFKSNFNSLYIKVDGKVVTKDSADHYVSIAQPLFVETNYAIDFNEEEQADYIVDIKANKNVSFTYSVDEQQHAFNNDADWNTVFDIKHVENGFYLSPKADALDALLGMLHESGNIDFSLPDEVANIFCMTISNLDGSIQHNIYFSLAHLRTSVVLDKTELIF